MLDIERANSSCSTEETQVQVFFFKSLCLLIIDNNQSLRFSTLLVASLLIWRGTSSRNVNFKVALRLVSERDQTGGKLPADRDLYVKRFSWQDDELVRWIDAIVGFCLAGDERSISRGDCSVGKPLILGGPEVPAVWIGSGGKWLGYHKCLPVFIHTLQVIFTLLLLRQFRRQAIQIKVHSDIYFPPFLHHYVRKTLICNLHLLNVILLYFHLTFSLWILNFLCRKQLINILMFLLDLLANRCFLSRPPFIAYVHLKGKFLFITVFFCRVYILSQ